MRLLLALLDRPETARSVLQTAALVAARLHGARIEVLHPRPATDPAFMPSEEVMTPDRQARFDAATAAAAAALRGIAETWRRESGIAAEWRELRGEIASTVAGEAAKADLVVMGRAAPHTDGKAIEAALFDAGATVLLAPDAVPATLGDHIAVAWKRGDCAERAIVAASPLLRAAGRVTLMTTNDGDEPCPPDALTAVLAERQQAFDLHPFVADDGSIGAALLREAHGVGADLLVMGAYGHRRLFEMLFGGTTRDILAAADLPVLLHH